jgi:2-phosphoglycerate kinase
MDPLLDAEGRIRGRRHVTVQDGKAGLPYSKGLMATSVMAAGLPPYEAFHVAEVIEERLHAEDRVAVTSAELRQIAALVLEEEVGLRYADNYRLWQQAQERKVPLIVLIGGATGVGKSTVATMVANRLGIVRIVSTDAVREVMRGIFTKEMMPSLHASSFEVTTLLGNPPGDGDPVIAGFREQVHAVAVGVAQLLRRALIEGTDVIVEGAHLVPGFLRLPPRDAAIVVPTVIRIEDEQVHRSHFVARASDVRRGGDQRYLNHFDNIRKIQNYVHALALEHGVPVVSSHALDSTVQRVVELVVSAATDAPWRESKPEPPVGHQSKTEVAADPERTHLIYHHGTCRGSQEQ